mmetsp:Transcript_13031/g.30840  ORF Transcript_13031/g.30840 Transcript_13031/m.30840 type:complete len:202 (-) Transcript_13031:246-851(-)
MSIPLTIEATDTTISHSVSVITLESVLSDSSIRFHHREEKCGRRMSQGPVALPTRKRSSKELLILFEYDDTLAPLENWRNATFPQDDETDIRSEFKTKKSARLENIVSSDASFGSSTSRRSKSSPSTSRRYNPSPSQDHLLERYMKLLEDAKAKKTAPQKPSRKASVSRMAPSSSMPLSMPVRKASMHDIHSFQGRRRDSV